MVGRSLRRGLGTGSRAPATRAEDGGRTDDTHWRTPAGVKPRRLFAPGFGSDELSQPADPRAWFQEGHARARRILARREALCRPIAAGPSILPTGRGTPRWGSIRRQLAARDTAADIRFAARWSPGRIRTSQVLAELGTDRSTNISSKYSGWVLGGRRRPTARAAASSADPCALDRPATARRRSAEAIFGQRKKMSSLLGK